MTFLEKAKRKLRLLELRRKVEKVYGGLKRETTNNVPNTKGEILLRKHVINLTTKHKGVITKWNIKSP